MSGVGLEKGFMRRYRKGLSVLIERCQFGSIFNSPCGDLNWVAVFLAEHPLTYVENDILNKVVDIPTDPFPEVNALGIVATAFSSSILENPTGALFLASASSAQMGP